MQIREIWPEGGRPVISRWWARGSAPNVDTRTAALSGPTGVAGCVVLGSARAADCEVHHARAARVGGEHDEGQHGGGPANIEPQQQQEERRHGGHEHAAHDDVAGRLRLAVANRGEGAGGVGLGGGRQPAAAAPVTAQGVGFDGHLWRGVVSSVRKGKPLVILGVLVQGRLTHSLHSTHSTHSLTQIYLIYHSPTHETH